MPPIAKKIKISGDSESKTIESFIDIELQQFQDEIRRIKGVKVEKVTETVCKNQTEPGEEDLKSYIQDQIQQSERRVQKRLDIIEQKLDRLLEAQRLPIVEQIEEEPPVEEHLLDCFEPEPVPVRDEVLNELDSRLFPIADEGTFDWFFQRLGNEEYRNQLIQSRWPLTRNVSTKSFQISVKDFLRMHFELTICVKYSCSGYGAHGIKKKKLDCGTLTNYVFECFNRGFPDQHSMHDVNKAIVQFWGRAPDTLHKQLERSLKQDSFSQTFDEG